ncbi:hypothetical protein [Kosakonia radicincitans]|uniref:hypothetical protein n=1 Tax=Kosakonia radicincitans TaxID=283686 RepID=UPI001FD53B82|nr:hypothetical protein [Kosakonia radicincitans]
MNRLNITSILHRMATGRDEEMEQLLTQLSERKKTAGSPLAIRFKPAVREFITLVSGRLGISSAELVNVLVEGIMRETLTPRQASVTRIPERFWLLMDEHKLSATDVACLLSDWNIGLSVLENRERTMDFLTSPLLKKLSEWFYVSVEWLEGTASRPVHHITVFNDWFHAARKLDKRIRETEPENILTRPDIYFVREMNITGGDQEDIFIFIRRYRTVNNTTVRIVECAGYCSTAGRLQDQFNSFLSMCGILFQAEIISKVDTFFASGQLLNALKTGDILPVSALWQIQKPCRNAEGKYTQNIWKTEERMPFLAPDEFITDEWREITSRILNNPDL